MGTFYLLGIFILPTVLGFTFENNGYKDVVVSIHPDIPQNQDTIDKIQVRNFI